MGARAYTAITPLETAQTPGPLLPIAEEDLRIRGPGEFYGTKQSGLPSLRIANVLKDVDILEESREDAFALVKGDPNLASSEHRKLREAVMFRFKGYELVAVS